MANPTWPASLPQKFSRNGYAEKRNVGTVRSKMDTGPDKVRRRFTAVPTTLAGSMKMTTAQTQTLDTFYQQTLAEGSLVFDWVHPRTGAAVSMRMLEPPDVRDAGPDRWAVNMKMEILP